MAISRISSWYKRYERHYSSAALIGGFIFDIFTLRRADTLWENSWIVLHLAIVGSVILYLSRREKGEKSESAEISRKEFWLLTLMQFSFGGLLSAFLILYFRSATLSVSWPFLLILALAFAANERLKGYHDRLIFQVAFFYLSLLSFFIYSIPVILGTIGPLIFVLSGIASLFAVRLFLKHLERVSKDRLVGYKRPLRRAILIIFATMNVLYFMNIIPPIPLSLKEGGIYHSLERDTAGNYILKKEDKKFLDYFRLHQKVHAVPGSPLFVYTAVFSPARFNISIVHEWQSYDESERSWDTVSKVSLPISGGRDTGYRTYSLSNVAEGRWRVNVLTREGLVLGRIGFTVEDAEDRPALVTEIH